jgi:hypothetical protein
MECTLRLVHSQARETQDVVVSCPAQPPHLAKVATGAGQPAAARWMGCGYPVDTLWTLRRGTAGGASWRLAPARWIGSWRRSSARAFYSTTHLRAVARCATPRAASDAAGDEWRRRGARRDAWRAPKPAAVRLSGVRRVSATARMPPESPPAAPVLPSAAAQHSRAVGRALPSTPLPSTPLPSTPLPATFSGTPAGPVPNGNSSPIRRSEADQPVRGSGSQPG